MYIMYIIMHTGVNFQEAEPNVFIFSPTTPIRQCFSIRIIQDNVVQTNSQILLVILQSSDASITLPRPSEILTIIDNDGKELSSYNNCS